MPGANIRPAVAAAIVGKGWQLFEMKSIAYSLEEIFLQVTRTDAAELPDDDEIAESEAEASGGEDASGAESPDNASSENAENRDIISEENRQ